MDKELPFKLVVISDVSGNSLKIILEIKMLGERIVGALQKKVTYLPEVINQKYD